MVDINKHGIKRLSENPNGREMVIRPDKDEYAERGRKATEKVKATGKKMITFYHASPEQVTRAEQRVGKTGDQIISEAESDLDKREKEFENQVGSVLESEPVIQENGGETVDVRQTDDNKKTLEDIIPVEYLENELEAKKKLKDLIEEAVNKKEGEYIKSLRLLMQKPSFLDDFGSKDAGLHLANKAEHQIKVELRKEFGDKAISDFDFHLSAGARDEIEKMVDAAIIESKAITLGPKNDAVETAVDKTQAEEVAPVNEPQPAEKNEPVKEGGNKATPTHHAEILPEAIYNEKQEKKFNQDEIGEQRQIVLAQVELTEAEDELANAKKNKRFPVDKLGHLERRMLRKAIALAVASGEDEKAEELQAELIKMDYEKEEEGKDDKKEEPASQPVLKASVKEGGVKTPPLQIDFVKPEEIKNTQAETSETVNAIALKDITKDKHEETVDKANDEQQEKITDSPYNMKETVAPPALIEKQDSPLVETDFTTAAGRQRHIDALFFDIENAEDVKERIQKMSMEEKGEIGKDIQITKNIIKANKDKFFSDLWADIAEEKLKAGNIGFAAEKIKSKIFHKIWQWLGGKTDKKGDGKNVKESFKQKFIVEFASSMAQSYKQAAVEAQKNIDKVNTGDKKTYANGRHIVGNIAMYGRSIADVFGKTAASPLRYAMMGAMFAAKASQNAIDASLRVNRNDMSQNAIAKDFESAQEEAWKLLEQAGGKGIATGADLEKAYEKNLPQDLLTRLKNKKVDAQEAHGLVKKLVEWDVRKSLEKISQSIEDIELSRDPKRIKEEKLAKKYKKYSRHLKDLDKIVSRYGTVDTLAMGAKYAETASKTVIVGLSVESLILLAENLPKTFKNLSGLFSHETKIATGPAAEIPDNRGGKANIAQNGPQTGADRAGSHRAAENLAVPGTEGQSSTIFVEKDSKIGIIDRLKNELLEKNPDMDRGEVSESANKRYYEYIKEHNISPEAADKLNHIHSAKIDIGPDGKIINIEADYANRPADVPEANVPDEIESDAEAENTSEGSLDDKGTNSYEAQKAGQQIEMQEKLDKLHAQLAKAEIILRLDAVGHDTSDLNQSDWIEKFNAGDISRDSPLYDDLGKIIRLKGEIAETQAGIDYLHTQALNNLEQQAVVENIPAYVGAAAAVAAGKAIEHVSKSGKVNQYVDSGSNVTEISIHDAHNDYKVRLIMKADGSSEFPPSKGIFREKDALKHLVKGFKDEILLSKIGNPTAIAIAQKNIKLNAMELEKSQRILKVLEENKLTKEADIIRDRIKKIVEITEQEYGKVLVEHTK